MLSDNIQIGRTFWSGVPWLVDLVGISRLSLVSLRHWVDACVILVIGTNTFVLCHCGDRLFLFTSYIYSIVASRERRMLLKDHFTLETANSFTDLAQVWYIIWIVIEKSRHPCSSSLLVMRTLWWWTSSYMVGWRWYQNVQVNRFRINLRRLE